MSGAGSILTSEERGAWLAAGVPADGAVPGGSCGLSAARGKAGAGPAGAARGDAAGQPSEGRQRGPGHRPEALRRRMRPRGRGQARAQAGVWMREAEAASPAGGRGGAAGVHPEAPAAYAGHASGRDAGFRGRRPP